MRDRHYGVESARRHLPELLERANRGESVIITKHGKPYATLVEPQSAGRRRGSFARLRGSGKGLWGRDPARAIDALRDEW
jgi:antitoxin (DNA-binding transcriptional repressor) of toxin-antitoxin stability system